MDQSGRRGLPLLAREMVQIAARPRTYLIRVIYAGILLLVSWIALYFNIPRGATPLTVLGRGASVLRWIDSLQTIGLQLVLPALACGVFTIEKERNTLGLLFLTRLGPWTILFEKLASRLLLALNFLMISLPILAFCHALGGITVERLLALLLGLGVQCLSIVCIAAMCSAYCRTTSSALLMTYLLGSSARFFVTVCGLAVAGVSSAAMADIIPRAMIYNDDLGFTAAVTGGSRLASLGILIVPWLGVCTICVVLARLFLVRRAYLCRGNSLMNCFRRLDRLFEVANENWLTRGLVVIPHRERLPDQDPIAWRESSTRSMGQVRYLIRILLVIEIPLFLILLQASLSGQQARLMEITGFAQVILWLILILVTTVISARLIGEERTRQTLDVLLTTPLHSHDIIEQKMAGVRRMIWILEIPLLTCVAFRFYVEQSLLYVLCQLAMLLIYPRLVAWLGMWHSLRSKTAVVAIVKTLLSILWRCLGPVVVAYAIFILLAFSYSPDMVELIPTLLWGSPLTLYLISHYLGEFVNGGTPVALNPSVCLVMTCLIQGGMLAWTRENCLRQAGTMLGRGKESDSRVYGRSALSISEASLR